MPSDDAWEKLLDRECALHSHAVLTKDFTFLQIRLAQAQTKSSQFQMFISDADKRAFDKIHEKTAKTAETDADDFRQHVEKNENNNKDLDDWECDMNDQERKLSEKAIKNIEKEFEEGKQYITDNVPKDQRKDAANVFQQGASMVMELFRRVSDVLSDVFSMVEDFLRKIWKGLEDAFKTVKSLVQDFIGGLSSGGIFFAKTPSSEATCDVSIDWPENFDFAAVMSTLSTIFTELADTEMIVDRQATAYDTTVPDSSAMQKKHMMTVVRLRSKSGSNGVTADSMKQEWERIVGPIVKNLV